MTRKFLCAALFSAALLFVGRLYAADPPEWTQPFPPFHIAGNLYYVGSADLAAYLIVTPQGNILINSNLESSPDRSSRASRTLGFHIQRHEDSAHQPRPLRSLRRQREGHEDDRRQIRSDGRRCSGGPGRRPKRLQLRQQQRPVVSRPRAWTACSTMGTRFLWAEPFSLPTRRPAIRRAPPPGPSMRKRAGRRSTS